MKLEISIGMITFNDESHVSESIKSLLNQTYKKFKLTIVDDHSTDGTLKKIAVLAKKDKRIQYYQNPKRLGYSANCRKCFEISGKGSNYFAWAGGHDIYRPSWLSELFNVLETNEDIVLAYPKTVRINEEGQIINLKSPLFETFGLNIYERMKKICTKGEGFGNMVYGLFRSDTIMKADIFPSSLVPDVLLLHKISLFGSIFQVNKRLWCRRYVGLFNIKRQKFNIFIRTPWYINIPWPFVNSYLLAKYAFDNRKSLRIGIFYPFFLGFMFLITHINALWLHY